MPLAFAIIDKKVFVFLLYLTPTNRLIYFSLYVKMYSAYTNIK